MEEINAEAVMGPLVYSRSAQVMVCNECKMVVLNPDQHLRNVHDFTVSPLELDKWPINTDWKPNKYGENKQL